MAFSSIPAGSVDAKSPLDETLMELIKSNQDDLDSRVTALGGGGSSVSSLALSDDPRLGRIISGVNDNLLDFKWFKFPANSNIAGSNPERLGSYDPEGTQHNINLPGKYGPDTTSAAPAINADQFNGQTSRLGKNEKRYFKVKKGLNWFAIENYSDTSRSDSVTVKIDGLGLIASGVLDEDGNVFSSDTYSTNTATIYFQRQRFFFGLDPDKEQLIEFENTDSASKEVQWASFSVGYATEPSVLAMGLKDTRHSKGIAIIRGSEVTIPETDFAFDAPLGFGRIDSMVSDTSGAISVIKGAEGAFTKAKIDTALDPSTSVVSVQNATFFPTKGFCLAQYPRGQSHIFSYTGKTVSLIHDHKFTGVVWENDKVPSITPDGSNNISGLPLGGCIGDVSIVLLADGTENAIEITASNNKLDWKQSEDGGSEGTFSLTIPDGLYSSDLMPLGNVIVRLMQSVAPLANKGSYGLEYSKSIHKWFFYILGASSTDTFSLPFSSGANQATSIHGELGFDDTDLTGDMSYAGTTEKQSLAWRTYDRGDFVDPQSPTIKYSGVDDNISVAAIDSLREFHNLKVIRTETGTELTDKIFPDKDSCGMEIYRVYEDSAMAYRYSIDGGEWIMGSFMNDRDTRNTSPGAKLVGITLTWPLGTKEVIMSMEGNNPFLEISSVGSTYFAGYRNLYPAPALVRLTSSQSAYKFVKIRPKVLYEEWYDHDYTIQSNAFESISNIVKTGSWSSLTSTNVMNQRYTQSVTLNDRIDVTFDVIGTCGGFAFLLHEHSTHNRQLEFYLSNGSSANIDTAHLLQRADVQNATAITPSSPFKIIGLPNGTYTASMVLGQAMNTQLVGYATIDDVENEPNATVVGELTNSARGISRPMWGGVDKIGMSKDGLDSVPAYLERTPYNRHRPAYYYRLNSDANFQDWSDSTTVGTRKDIYFVTQWTSNNVALNQFGFFQFAETMFSIDTPNTGSVTQLDPSIDGRIKTQYSQRVELKGGSAAGSSNLWAHPLFKYNFFRNGSISMSDSTTITVTQTRGLRVGQNIILKDSTLTEPDSYHRIVSLVTDTSVTINKAVGGAFAGYDTVNFAGFHNLLWENQDADEIRMGGLGYVMLPVQAWQYKSLKDNAGEIAESFQADVTSGIDVPPPHYSDGTAASFSEIVSFGIARNTAGATWDFSQEGWRNPVTAGTCDILYTAIRRKN